ncbi:hypothetical protein [Saccharopolyspora hattusasensis]|uniref:hypothetical protein n=1 Tax=Saccharopolyspora hattusasensis TaxID=1128679 RepID=UPI003D956971
MIAFNSSALYLGMGFGGLTGGAVAAEWGWVALGPVSTAVALLAPVLFWRTNPTTTATPGTAAAPAQEAQPVA